MPHISLVFREMWDTAVLPLKPPGGTTLRTGALRTSVRGLKTMGEAHQSLLSNPLSFNPKTKPPRTNIKWDTQALL
jgi:hypothetical protein